MTNTETRVFKAYGTKGAGYATTPRAAAAAFFERNTGARKCNVIEGWDDGQCFIIKYGNPFPKSWRDIAKKTVNTLPDTTTGE